MPKLFLTAKQAFYGMLLCFILSPLLYFLVMEFGVIGLSPGFSPKPKQFFLEEVQGQKLVIEAGSNALHGFDAKRMEAAIQIPVVNHARNGSFPLNYRIYNLLAYLKQGDIVLFPLEWQYYSGKDEIFHTVQVGILNGTMKYFYMDLPLQQKLHFLFATASLTALGEGLGSWQLPMHALPGQTRQKQLDYIYHELQKHRGSELAEPNEKVRASQAEGCYEYIFTEQLKNNFQFSVEFRENLKLLQKLKAKGVTIIFTPPTVVSASGEECYPPEKEHLVQPFLANLKALVQKEGFLFLGEKEDSAFGKDSFRDTSYHVFRPAAETRTDRVVKRLREAGLLPLHPHSKGTVAKTDQMLLQLTNRLRD